MSELTVGIKLKADGSGLVGEVRVSRAELDKLAGTVSTAENKAKSYSSQIDRQSLSFSSLSKNIAALGLAIGGVDIARQFISANATIESFRSGLLAIGGNSSTVSSDLEYLTGVTHRLGTVFLDSSTAFLNLSASASGTSLQGQGVRDIFEAVSGAMSKLGRSGAETSGALYAIGQMMSKGTVAAEELRGQLGERLPGAFTIAARAMNVTTAELGDMLEKGQLVSGDFLPKFAAELKKSFGTGADEIKTFRAEVARIKNAWDAMLINLGDSGAFSALTVTLSTLAKHMDLVAIAGGAVASIMAGRGVSALAAYSAAQIAATSVAIAAAGAQTRLATATVLASRAMAVAGGPVGLIVSIAAGLGLWALTAGTATAETNKLVSATDGLASSINRVSAADAAGRIVQLRESLAKLGGASTGAGAARLREMIAENEGIIRDGARQQAKIQAELDRLAGGKGTKKKRDRTAEMYGADQVAKRTNQLTNQQSQQAGQLTQSVRTPDEVFDDELTRYKTLLDKKLITGETYNRAALQQLDTYLKAATTVSDELSATEIQRRVEDAQQANDLARERLATEFATVQDGLKSQEQLMEESYFRRNQIVADAVAQRLITEDQAQAATVALADQYNKELLEKNKTFAQEYSDVWGNAAAGFTENIGRSVADAMLEQKKFSDLLRVSVRSMARELTAAFVSIAARRAVDFALGEFFKTASTVTSVGAAKVTALAWAPAAAAVSLATVGTNAVPATAGIASAYALSGGLALTGMAHDGLDYVPKTGTFLLEQGERVVKKEDNKRLENFLTGANAGSININFNVTGTDAPRAADIVRSQRGQIISIIQSAYDERGRRGGPVS